ncbi:MAG: glucans biosynthesis glucosyltransferase MdoH [Gammaproteobacteria bacterium]
MSDLMEQRERWHGLSSAQGSRQERRVDKALSDFFAKFGIQEPAHRIPLIAQIRAVLPEQSRPSEAVVRATRRLDAWLRGLARSLGLPFDVGIEVLRAALVTAEIGRRWPQAFLAEQLPAEFLAALRQALPIAYPPEQPLSMPEQSLAEWQGSKKEEDKTAVGPRAWSRRSVVFGLGFGTTVAATFELYRVFEPAGITTIEIVLLVLFALNLLWIGITFWSALAGFMVLWNREQTTGLVYVEEKKSQLREKTAVLLPIHNEPPRRVFAALEAMYASLQATGQMHAFEFFVLSDTTDPDLWLAEELAWDDTRQRLGATGRLFYRRRNDNVGRKAGNIADFCRRWGGRYQHMIVLDADSLMDGETMVRLVRLMEANPGAGILQTVPYLVNRNTLFARAQQFAGRLYGPVLGAGLAFWHLGDSNYWGHNAIIRVQAFAAHAGLPQLKGRSPFGGHILSHDFVEAALLRRGGWRVFLVPVIEGSYEEPPPSLIAHAQRDRRWCQGNLQHMAVLGAKGLHPLSRVHLFTGIMAYLASPLWLAFLITGIIATLQSKFELPVYFFPEETPYPVWHVIDPVLAARLFVLTMGVLLAPKLFGLLSLLGQPKRAREFGGMIRASLSVLAETVHSALIAPVLMLLQSRFVVNVLLGRDSGWQAQTRDDRGIAWSEAYHRHRWHTAIGVLLAIAVYSVSPVLLAWMSPAIAGMILSIPVSYLGSRLDVGLMARRAGVFLIPEESAPPPILMEATKRAAAIERTSPSPGTGVRSAVLDQRAGALHLALLSQNPLRERNIDSFIARHLAAEIKTSDDLCVLNSRQQLALLCDPPTLLRLRRLFRPRVAPGPEI